MLEQVAAEGDGLREALTGWRWVRPESLHLTLRFLGEVAPDLDRRARAVWAEIVAGAPPVELRLGTLGRFPPRGMPCVLWLGVEEIGAGGILSGLAARLEAAARELGWSAQQRPFRSHMTLARARRGVRPDEPPVTGTVPESRGWIRRVALVRSHLDPGGARYTELESYALGGSPSAESDQERAD
jgi:2'-5' RNA ligase